MKRSTIVTIISLVFILLFLYTASSKLFEYSFFKRQLAHQPITEHFVLLLSIFIPTIEIVTALALIIPKYQKIGLILSFYLMSTFTIYIGYMIYIWPHKELPCSCGGVIRSLSWGQHLAFNISLLILAVIGNRLYSKTKSSSNFINHNSIIIRDSL
jgi:putative oxidoreductase